MNKLLDIQNQIEKLQKQAADIKAKEFQGTVQEIIEKMQAFGITVKDLQGAKSSKPRKTTRAVRGKKKSARTPVEKPVAENKKSAPAKYRGPNGETWSGRGLTPRWLSALIAQGHDKESFEVGA